MPASEMSRPATQSQSIPTRRVLLHDPTQLPFDYSSTPGGTLYSTTPGGTRIIYEKAALMNLKNSPLSRTPPKFLEYNDHILKMELPVSPLTKPNSTDSPTKKGPSPIDESHEQFELDL